ncbi:MAG: hypothetical protein AAF909_05575 [Pseudomonadota bacterium]
MARLKLFSSKKIRRYIRSLDQKRKRRIMADAADRPRPAHDGAPVDLVITTNEISYAHGTGVQMSRLFEGRRDVIAIRSQSYYGGAQRIDAVEELELPREVCSNSEIAEIMKLWLRPYHVRSILSPIFLESDIVMALAAKQLTGAPLGLWVMDDNCLQKRGVGRRLMARALAQADARFAISREMKDLYERAFGHPFAIAPPLVAPALLRQEPSAPAPSGDLLMIGNVWSVRILDRLSQTVEAAGLKVDWRAPNPDLWGKILSADTLEQRGVRVGPEADPAALNGLTTAAAAILVPSDSGAFGKTESAIGDLSLPSRMPFILATSGTPMIVLGRPDTAAARFVRRYGVGEVSPYEPDALAEAVRRVSALEAQAEIRARAARLASRFSFDGAYGFIFSTIAAGGAPPDDRFETLFPPLSEDGPFRSTS